MSKETLPRPEGELEALAARYANADISEFIDRAPLITEPAEAKPTITVRVSAQTLDELKSRADAQHVRYTVLARQLLEEGLHTPRVTRPSQLEARVTRLEELMGAGTDLQE